MILHNRFSGRSTTKLDNLSETILENTRRVDKVKKAVGMLVYAGTSSKDVSSGKTRASQYGDVPENDFTGRFLYHVTFLDVIKWAICAIEQIAVNPMHDQILKSVCFDIQTLFFGNVLKDKKEIEERDASRAFKDLYRSISKELIMIGSQNDQTGQIYVTRSPDVCASLLKNPEGLSPNVLKPRLIDKALEDVQKNLDSGASSKDILYVIVQRLYKVATHIFLNG